MMRHFSTHTSLSSTGMPQGPRVRQEIKKGPVSKIQALLKEDIPSFLCINHKLQTLQCTKLNDKHMIPGSDCHRIVSRTVSAGHVRGAVRIGIAAIDVVPNTIGLKVQVAG